MTKHNPKAVLLNRFWTSYNGGQTHWDKENLAKELNWIGLKDLTDPSIQCTLKELEADGHIQLRYQDDRYLNILKPGLNEFLARLKKTPFAHEDMRNIFLACFFEFFDHGDMGWSKDELRHVAEAVGKGGQLDDLYIRSCLRDLENKGFIRLCQQDDRYVMVAELASGLDKYRDAGIPKLPLSDDGIKGMLLGGFQRFYSEGMRVWSREDLRKALHGKAAKDDPADPKNQAILKELDAEGHIKLRGQDDVFVEVLG